MKTAPERRSRWAWRVGRIAGIDLYVHATFTILLSWIAIAHLAGGGDLASAARGIVLVLAVFGIVVLHELGHALAARRFGIPTRDITLYPIGGIARLERMPERPGQELIVALAGPAVNGALAALLFLWLAARGTGISYDPLAIESPFAVQLMWINISLGVFNLLPAFPMDGGRALRAILAFRLERARATAIAAYVGRGFAVLLAIIGLFANPMLILIAAFVWITAGMEAAAEEMKSSLQGLSVGDAMVGRFHTLHPQQTLATAGTLLADGFQHDFPIVDDGRVVGLLTRDEIVRGLATRAVNTPVGFLMHRSFPIAGSGEELRRALERMPADGSSLVVLHDERPVGLLDPAHVEDVLAFQRLARAGRDG